MQTYYMLGWEVSPLVLFHAFEHIHSATIVGILLNMTNIFHSYLQKVNRLFVSYFDVSLGYKTKALVVQGAK